jgi:hypothetical protein
MTIIYLTQNEIKNLSSNYISQGLKTEKWSINEMKITEDGAELQLKMTDISISTTDNNGFHLSFLIAMEMIAQMMVIYLHYQAGLKIKSREIWVSSINSKFISPIRNPDSIYIKMTSKKLKLKGTNLICDARCDISSSTGGLFQSDGRVWLL